MLQRNGIRKFEFVAKTQFLLKLCRKYDQIQVNENTV